MVFSYIGMKTKEAKWQRKAGRMKNSLKIKMIAMMSAVVLVITSGVAFVGYRWSARELEKEVENRLKAKLNATKNQFELENRFIESTLNGMGELPSIKRITVLEKNSPLLLRQEVYTVLRNVKSHQKDNLESLFLADTKGQIIFNSEVLNPGGLNIKDRQYFQTAIKGDSVWSSILSSKESGNPVRIYAYPFKNEKDKTIGVLGAVVKMEPLFQTLQNLKEGKEGYAYLTDKEGLFVYHPHADYMMKKRIQELDIEELKKAFSQMASGKDGQVVYTLDGEEKLNLFTPVDDYSLSLNAVKSEYLGGLYKMRNQIVVISVFFLILGAGASILISQYILKRIRSMQSVMFAAENGNLTSVFTIKGEKPTEGDEIIQMGISLNQMLSRFREIIFTMASMSQTLTKSSQDLNESAHQGGQAAEEVTANIEQIATNAEEQNGQIKETQTLIFEMKEQLDQSSKSTDHMEEKSSAVLQTTQKGKEQMKDTINQMQAIREGSEKSQNVIEALTIHSERIASISDTILNIADQTNLLALNASIEAARAGEQGRGFAVVAEEIRKLAIESQESATGITELITGIQREIKSAGTIIQEESKTIYKGIASIEKTGVAFEDIAQNIIDTSEFIKEVTGSVQGTDTCAQKVIDAMAFLSEMATETATSAESVSGSAQEQSAIAEEIAGSATELSNLSEKLTEMVEHFQV